jgi:hypothetical protein
MYSIKLKEVDSIPQTGPIDDPHMIDAGECPKCGENTLWHYPEQDGRCHSGLHSNHWGEFYGCDNPECCSIFVEQA